MSVTVLDLAAGQERQALGLERHRQPKEGILDQRKEVGSHLDATGGPGEF